MNMLVILNVTGRPSWAPYADAVYRGLFDWIVDWRLGPIQLMLGVGSCAKDWIDLVNRELK